MAKVTVTLNLSDVMLDELRAEAARTKKSFAYVVAQKLEKPTTESGASDSETQKLLLHLLDKFYHFEAEILGSNMAIGELAMRAVRASAGARFYARVATSFEQDLAHYLTNGQVQAPAVKKRQFEQMDVSSVAFEKYYLTVPYERLVENPAIAVSFEEKQAALKKQAS